MLAYCIYNGNLYGNYTKTDYMIMTSTNLSHKVSILQLVRSTL